MAITGYRIFVTYAQGHVQTFGHHMMRHGTDKNVAIQIKPQKGN
jgi:hypothetical protein